MTAQGASRPRFGHAVSEQLSHFAAVARAEAPSAITAVDGLRALEVALAAEQSLATGDTVILIRRTAN